MVFWEFVFNRRKKKSSSIFIMRNSCGICWCSKSYSIDTLHSAPWDALNRLAVVYKLAVSSCGKRWLDVGTVWHTCELHSCRGHAYQMAAVGLLCTRCPATLSEVTWPREARPAPHWRLPSSYRPAGSEWPEDEVVTWRPWWHFHCLPQGMWGLRSQQVWLTPRFLVLRSADIGQHFFGARQQTLDTVWAISGFFSWSTKRSESSE